MKQFPDEVGTQFCLEGSPTSSVLHGNGNVNDTFLLSCEKGGSLKRYTVQRINHEVFKDPEGLMENFSRVTEHLRGKLSGKDSSQRSLRLVPARDGRSFVRDSNGNYWRAMEFIGGSESLEVPDSPRQAYEAAKAFGEFQANLADLPGSPLLQTIPDFHNTRKRFDYFCTVVEKDSAGRLSDVRDLVDFALSRESLADAIDSNNFPVRVVHNDTKLNNVLFDGETGEGICVVDLDTVMPGLSLYDFGDLVRTAATTAAEDERDLNKVRMDIQLFSELVRGYLDALGGALEDQEIRNLAFSARLITMEIGMRFLTDFLEGDIYFKIHREGHNLDRARNQFQLVRSMEAQVDEMEAVVEKYR